jgi:hypothetical protein
MKMDVAKKAKEAAYVYFEEAEYIQFGKASAKLQLSENSIPAAAIIIKMQMVKKTLSPTSNTREGKVKSFTTAAPPLPPQKKNQNDCYR